MPQIWVQATALASMVLCLCQFGTVSLAGTDTGKIFYSTDGLTWIDTGVDQDFLVQNPLYVDRRITAFAEFGGYCYAAANINSGYTSHVFRSSDGIHWSQVWYAGALDSTEAGGITALSVFGGYLYAAVSHVRNNPLCMIFRTADGETWVDAHSVPGHDYVFAQTYGAPRALCAIGSTALLCGLDSGEIIRSTNGYTWSSVYDDSTENDTDPGIFAVVILDGSPYALAWWPYTQDEFLRVIKGAADGSSWSVHHDSASIRSPRAAYVYDGKIWCVTMNGEVYTSANGSTWTRFEDDPPVAATALASMDAYRSSLFAGCEDGAIYYLTSELPAYAPVFPVLRGRSWETTRTPVWNTLVQGTASGGAEVRVSLATYPRYRWSVKHSVLRSAASKAEFQTLLGFYNQVKGRGLPFYYRDLEDCAVTGESLGTGDGETLAFPCMRTLGGFQEPVFAPDSLAVYLDGVQVFTGWGVETVAGMTVVLFDAAPGDGVAITADIGFYWPCRMVSDEAEFQNFLSGRWAQDGIEFISLKSGEAD